MRPQCSDTAKILERISTEHETQQSDDYHQHDLEENGQNLFCTLSIVNIHQSLQTDFLVQILLTTHFFAVYSYCFFFIK